MPTYLKFRCDCGGTELRRVRQMYEVTAIDRVFVTESGRPMIADHGPEIVPADDDCTTFECVECSATVMLGDTIPAQSDLDLVRALRAMPCNQPGYVEPAEEDEESEQVYGCPCGHETPMSEGFPPSCPNCGK